VKSLLKKVQYGSLKLSNPEELTQFTVIDLWENTHRQIMNSEKKHSGRRQARKFETFEAWSPEVDPGH
jgi:hypothetical protein